MPREGSHEDADPLDVARHSQISAYQETLLAFEEHIASWLADDPENWPVLRLVLLDPWRDSQHHWREDAPGWLRVLGSSAESAQEKFGPFGRQPAT